MDSRVGMLHLSRMFMTILLWIPLMQSFVKGMFTKVTIDPDTGKEDWMLKDTKHKATMCAILYGTLFPAM